LRDVSRGNRLPLRRDAPVPMTAIDRHPIFGHQLRTASKEAKTTSMAQRRAASFTKGPVTTLSGIVGVTDGVRRPRQQAIWKENG